MRAHPNSFERLIWWYPAAWRNRYGAELTALLEDSYADTGVPLRVRAALVRAGLVERVREVDAMGRSTDPGETTRAGALLVLYGWAMFLSAGSMFAKFSEHWNSPTVRAAQWFPSLGYRTVQLAGGLGVLLTLAAAVLSGPPLIRLVRRGGWDSVRRPILRALVSVALAVVVTVGVVMWAHHLSAHARNGGLTVYALVLILWGLVLVGTLVSATAAAASVARHATFERRRTDAIGRLAQVVTITTVAVAVGVADWWIAMAHFDPRFLAGGALAYSGVLPLPLIVAALLMLTGLVLALVGAVRVSSSMRQVVPGEPVS